MTTLPTVRTGVANLAAVAAAFARLSVQLVPATAADVAAATPLLLPGVGQFGAAMAELSANGLVAPLQQRLAAGHPTLGICLGMQLCCRGSDEAPGVPGLGVIDAMVTRFPADVRCPQMGWNEVDLQSDAGPGLVWAGLAYYANSYRLAAAPAGYRSTTSDHGGRFVATLERGRVLLCQFHPELSGNYGHALLQRWLVAAGVAC